MDLEGGFTKRLYVTMDFSMRQLKASQGDILQHAVSECAQRITHTLIEELENGGLLDKMVRAAVAEEVKDQVKQQVSDRIDELVEALV
jgi:hypothetical protein